MPVSGSKFAIFVAGIEEGGVVGLQGSNIVCFTCEHQANSCEHVEKLRTTEEELVFEMPDFLMDFFAEKHFRASSAASTTETTRKEWYAKSVSAKKISFELTVCQRQVFSKLEEVLNAKITSSNGLVTLIPEFFSSYPICPKCQTQCSEWCSRKVSCFLKKTVFRCEGKESFFFINENFFHESH